MTRDKQTQELLHVLATNVRSRRQTLHLTQEQLAERVGMSVNFIARVEIGLTATSLKTLSKLAIALGTSPSDLLAEHHKVDVKTSETCTIEGALKGLNTEDAAYVATLVVGLSRRLRSCKSGE